MRKRTALIAGLIAALLIAGGAYYLFIRPASRQPDQAPNNSSHTGQQTPEQLGTSQQTQQAVDTAEKPKYDTDSPSSLTVVVNKNRPLPAEYVPADLLVPDVRLRLAASNEQMKFRAAAADELKQMFDAAARDGVTLVFGSGYRSYSLQKQFYESYVARDGREAADRYSARPGTSEHQTGLSFDATSPSQTCHLEVCFEDTPQGTWLAQHAREYGFHLRYPEGKETVTGYQYEPWHFRYVGAELATELHENNLTLEEFFEL